MKPLQCLLFFLLLLPLYSLAQAPQGINYQAIARYQGVVVANQTIDLRITIYDGPGATNVVYVETHQVLTSQFGLFHIEIGNGVPNTGIFSDVDWSTGDEFMEVEIDANGGGFVSLGSKAFWSVPYSLHAETAGKSVDMEADDLTDIDTSGLANGDYLQWDGTNWVPAGGTNLSYTGGDGVSITGNVINNTGDTLASDDITIGFPAAGDLTGTYPSPTVSRIQNVPILNSPPSANQVLKFNNGTWAPSLDNVNDSDSDPSNELQLLSLSGSQLSLSNGGGNVNLPTNIAGVGINITGSVISNTGDLNAFDDVIIGSAAGGDLNGTYPNPIVSSIHGRSMANTAPNNNYVYKWDNPNQQWIPSPDNVNDADADPTNEIQTLAISGNTLSLSAGGGSVLLPTYVGGAGMSVIGNILVNTGDVNPNDDILIGSSAGGDLSGTYPNPTVNSIQGLSVANTNPSAGEVLKWNGSQWAPSSDDNTTYTAGTGLNLVGNVFTNTGDTDASDDITNTTSANGDLDGVFPTLTVSAIQGSPVANTAPSNGQILKWNGSQWAPGSDIGVNYSAGTGISVIGSVISNTGDTDASDDITTASVAGGDATGTFSNLTTIALQGSPLSPTTPTSAGQALMWNGSAWAPGNPGSTQWTTSGNNISYSTGNVGINTTTPTAELEVNGTSTVVNASGDIRVESGIINDEGYVSIYDSNNALKAGLRINGAGMGEVFGDIKNFRIDHPTSPEHEIWYASLEGPEAAAYVRGTATLVDGKIEVEFDDHFQLVSNPESMTVILTPLSADSKGLAVIEKTEKGFSVKELFSGQGNYSFDWEVKCVRRGHEDFEVIRKKQ